MGTFAQLPTLIIYKKLDVNVKDEFYNNNKVYVCNNILINVLDKKKIF